MRRLLLKEEVPIFKEWFSQVWFRDMPNTMQSFLAFDHLLPDAQVSLFEVMAFVQWLNQRYTDSHHTECQTTALIRLYNVLTLLLRKIIVFKSGKYFVCY